ncbi:hypothetical protein TWF506_003069 [Arthrobotrys conoides]|uniref:Uncharacterized protein n=1 Tax=Arthrobotrys conoides TaxID=74498 RepID=A0AAN8N4W7_9PEZI
MLLCFGMFDILKIVATIEILPLSKPKFSLIGQCCNVRRIKCKAAAALARSAE